MADAPRSSDVLIHDWTRVDDGTWHSFHHSLTGEIKRFLNNGVLPDGYYADSERHAPPYEPDVLALQEASDEIMDDVDDTSGGTAVAVAPKVTAAPTLSLHFVGDVSYASKQLRVAIRHKSGDRVVALIEITSQANKNRRSHVEQFVKKTTDALASGVHVSIIDILPPTRHDAPGLIARCAEAADLGELVAPPDKPLMIGAFESHAGTPGITPVELWAEPLAVGDALPDLPIFYREDRFVNIPLAATYAAAWEATPKRWRKVVEA
jgi:hypothetical protein